MNKYEFTFLVFDPKSVEKVEEIIASFGGKVNSKEPWGKRELAYSIEKKDSAEYHTWEIEIEKKQISDFETKLNYENVPVRFLILAKDNK